MMSLLSSVVTIGGVALSPLHIVGLLVAAFVLYTVFLHSGRPKGNPLVWSWVPHLRSAALFGADPNTFLAKCKASYGPVFTVNLGGKLMTFVTEPACYPLITKARDGLSFAAVAATVAQDVLSQDRDYAEDSELDAQVHQQYAKFLTGAHLDDITQTFQTHLQDWFAIHHQKTAARGSSTGGLLDLCTRSIFSASTRALFGDLLVDEDVKTDSLESTKFRDNFYAPSKLLSAFQEFDSIFPMLYGGLPHFMLRKGVDARNDMIKTLHTLRKDHCAFMAARRELMADSPPTKRSNDVHNHASSQLGMLWALQGNTIPATFWTIFHLLKDPAAMARVQDEINAVVAEENADNPTADKKRVTFTRDSLKKLTLLDCALSEALRLATGSMMMRRATKDMTLDLPTGPLPVKAGGNIAIYPYLAHHDASLFPEPEKFDLDRWVGKPIEGSMVTNAQGEKVQAFLPFGAGISMCPGRHFARNEIKMAVVTMLNLFEITPASLEHPGYLLSRAGLGIFPPAKDVKIVYSTKA